MALRSNYPNLQLATALPVLDALIFEEYERHPDIAPILYRMATSSRWGEQTSTMAGIKPAIEKFEGEAVAFDDAIHGYDKTYTHTTYAMAVSFSEELIEDDRLNMIEDTYRSLGLSMSQTRQIQAALPFNNGFSDTGPDGDSLFHTAHALIGGGTYGNRPSTEVSLSVAGIREMEISMMNQVNQRNINVMIQPELFLVPPNLKFVGKELLKSQDRPDTANRAMNTFYDEGYQMVVSPFLTSVTAWFVLASKAVHQFRWYERVAPSTRSWEDEKTGDMNTRIRSRFSNGYSEFIGSWGTTG